MESIIEFTRGKRNGELLFNGYRIFVQDDEKVLDIASDDSCIML